MNEVREIGHPEAWTTATNQWTFSQDMKRPDITRWIDNWFELFQTRQPCSSSSRDFNPVLFFHRVWPKPRGPVTVPGLPWSWLPTPLAGLQFAWPMCDSPWSAHYWDIAQRDQTNGAFFVLAGSMWDACIPCQVCDDCGSARMATQCPKLIFFYFI